MKSLLFHSNDYKAVQRGICDLINNSKGFLTERTAQSPRAVGDAIESIVTDSFGEILGGHCAEYSSEFSRRAMADLAFKDHEGAYYIVDVKTHRTDAQFNMPNLTSVERLARFYKDDTNFFTVLLISYNVEGMVVTVTDVAFVPIEFLGWNCLTIGALGWGQIQIANSNNVTVNHGYPRKQWMIELCDIMREFYPREIAKIGERASYFEDVRAFWEHKPNE
ncbi:MAG: hypothetical protein IT211_12490 [Armatimonadetes bacterium]|nr:hypothetical protein [Armatimonadota bacterium]